MDGVSETGNSLTTLQSSFMKIFQKRKLCERKLMIRKL